MRRLIAAAVAVGVAGAAGGRADGPVALAYRAPKPGDRYKVAAESKTVNTIVVSVMGQDQTQKVEFAAKCGYTSAVVAWPEKDGGRTEVTREYTLAEQVANGTDVDHKLAGRTVKVVGDGGKWAHTFADGGEVPAEAGPLLYLASGPTAKVADLLPGKPVKPGDAWDLDAKALAAEVAGNADVDAPAGSATAKLVKVYAKNGRTFGVIEAAAEFGITALKADDGKAQAVKPGSKVAVAITLDACLDGGARDLTAKKEVTMEVRPDLEGAGADVTVTVTTNWSAAVEDLTGRK